MFLHCADFVFCIMIASYSALPKIEKMSHKRVERSSSIAMRNQRSVHMAEACCEQPALAGSSGDAEQKRSMGLAKVRTGF